MNIQPNLLIFFLLTTHILSALVGTAVSMLAFKKITSAISNKTLQKNEKQKITKSFRNNWINLLILTLTGGTLFAFNPQELINSPLFLAKITIVIATAASLHLLSRSIKMSNKKPVSLKQNTSIVANSTFQTISWISIIIAGISKNPETLSYIQLILMYSIFAAIGLLAVSFFIKSNHHNVQQAKLVKMGATASLISSALFFFMT